MNDRKYKQNLWPRSAFTACTTGSSLLEPMTDAAEIAARLATNLLSIARSSFDGFQNARKSGENLCGIAKSISRGRLAASPNIRGGMPVDLNQNMCDAGKYKISFRGFLREKHETKNLTTQTSLQKGRHSAKENE
jgi:hypothetical protein